jgi:Omp85 superfamily domain
MSPISVARTGAVCALLLFAPLARAQSGRELNVIPIAGGDSDVGIGGGLLGDLAALAPGRPPFRWRLEAAAFVTFKVRKAEGLILPYQDYYLDYVVPRTGPGGNMRFDIRPSFTNEVTLRYYGMGNAAPPLAAGADVETLEYERLHPTLSAEVRYRLVDSFYVLAGTAYTYNRLKVPPMTVLARDHDAGPADVRALLGNFAPHGVELLTLEAGFDGRDDETVTRHGQFHTLRFRVSPHVGGALPYQYERLTLTSRFYWTPIERWLTVSTRLVGDTIFGDAPFYELARFDETPAIGGGKAVRGVPAQRYYGKVKAFGNIEAISELLPFTVKQKHLVLGLAAFFDGGRSWTEISRSHPDLDGTGIGLKYGIGGGLRLEEGRTFVVRFDVAWSPDASPVGAYFAAGEIF